MDDQADAGRLDPRLADGLADGRDHGFLGRRRRGQHLGGDDLAVIELERDVGEGPADVHGDPAMQAVVSHAPATDPPPQVPTSGARLPPVAPHASRDG